VSLDDVAFGTTTMHINDYPEQLRLARTEALYLCRKHSGLAAATSAGFQPSIPDSCLHRPVHRAAQALLVAELVSHYLPQIKFSKTELPDAAACGRAAHG
jgi:hypothetical protein